MPDDGRRRSSQKTVIERSAFWHCELSSRSVWITVHRPHTNGRVRDGHLGPSHRIDAVLSYTSVRDPAGAHRHGFTQRLWHQYAGAIDTRIMKKISHSIDTADLSA